VSKARGDVEESGVSRSAAAGRKLCLKEADT